MEQKNNHADSPLLVTGASGFIGSFLVERALEEGREVWAAVRRTSSRRYLSDPRIRFIELDLGNDERLKQQLTQHLEEHAPFGAVIHAAGATRAKDEEEFCRINAEGTLRLALTLLETQALQPNGRFVFISSLSVCGDIHELDREPLRPTDTPLPNTAYGRSKLKAERMLADVPGLNYVVLRPTGVYGPREKDYFLMAKSIKQHVDFAVGFKPQILTFIYVRDLVEAAFLALNRGKRGAIYHLSDGRNYTSRSFSDLLQLELGVKRVVHIVAPLWVLRIVSFAADKIARAAKKTSTLNPDKCRIMKQRNWQCDITAARKELNYHPQWPLTRGVKEAVEWYKKEHWL